MNLTKGPSIKSKRVITICDKHTASSNKDSQTLAENRLHFHAGKPPENPSFPRGMSDAFERGISTRTHFIIE